MKCELAQEKIALTVYGELPDESSPELNQHLAACERCRRELEAVRGLYQAMFLYPAAEPSANLLARARMRLEEAIDNLPRQSWLLRSVQSFLAGASRLRTAPVAASALLILGVGLGSLGGYHLAEGRQAALNAARSGNGDSALAPSDAATLADVANVSSIVREPDSEMVDVTYNRLVPQKLRGSLDDPAIRGLLLAAMQSDDNSGVRSDSVGLLAAECRAGHQCTGGPMRDALMVAARYDGSSAVRRKALAGLEPYIAEDMRVRDAVLEILMNDDDPAVRTQALNVLEPVQADSSVRQVLHTVAVEDQNPHIRTASRQTLSQLPEIQ